MNEIVKKEDINRLMTHNISPAKAIANQVAGYVRDNGMASPVGGEVTKDFSERNQRYYRVEFSMPATYRDVLADREISLDGSVQIYGPKFLRLNYRLGSRARSSAFVYDNLQNLLDALECLRESRWDDVANIPTKPPRRGRESSPTAATFGIDYSPGEAS